MVNPHSNRLVIQYRIRYGSWVNPPGRAEKLSADLVQEVLRRGWDCYNGALGGGMLTHGVVYKLNADMTVSDRTSIAEWIRAQPVCASIGLGDPEPEETSDILRDVMEYCFEVDNLTEDDRRAAAAFRDRVLRSKP